MERSEFANFNFLIYERSYIAPVWLTWIFSILILLDIFAWIGLSIYQKIRQIQCKKKEKKELEKKEDIK
ncbi:MAG: hypothetical protein OHM56_11285 [Spiroplasma phoeniceum]|nr:MAG: hypothetical protein OHM57_10705 [Spiroplasma phoeniceum]UZQ32133.1 MAG: hypothetical protein OHM56_11285 [Spiroplasma phoeniceum]